MMLPWVVLALILFSPQSTPGFFHGVRGTIMDPSGQGIPEALVVLQNLQTGEQQRLKVEQEGKFVFECVPDGDYRLTFSSLGFLTSTIEKLHYWYPKDVNLSVRMNFEPIDHGYIWPGHLLVIEIVDSNTQAPVGNTNVDVTGDTLQKRLSLSTDTCGKAWTYVMPGKYTLAASMVGFQKASLSLDINGPKSVKIALKR